MVNISKGDLVELKSLANPPVAVKNTLSVVMILFNEKTDWRDIQKAMANPWEFLRKIANYDVNNMPDKILKKAREALKELEIDQVKKVSAAAVGILKEVMAIVALANLARQEKKITLIITTMQGHQAQVRQELDDLRQQAATLSDATGVAGTTWKNLKTPAMKSDYKTQSWYHPLTEQERELIEALREAQRGQGNMNELQSQVYKPK